MPLTKQRNFSAKDLPYRRKGGIKKGERCQGKKKSTLGSSIKEKTSSGKGGISHKQRRKITVISNGEKKEGHRAENIF